MLSGLIVFIKKAIGYIIRIPAFLVLLERDFIEYYIFGVFREFRKFGLHIWVAKFGGGKTSSMVYTAYRLCKQYPQVSVLTNIQLFGFPEHTAIYQLRTVDDILNAPDNCIVLIDEIGTLFNSRDFMKGNSLPKILFQHLCQCRKRHMVIFGTVQRWQFLDKQLRDITTTVRVCRSTFGDPFTRLTCCTVYDAPDYERAYNNPMLKIAPIGCTIHLQTDKVRSLYDTSELIDSLMEMEYEDDATILNNQGVGIGIGVPMDKKDRRRASSGARRLTG